MGRNKLIIENKNRYTHFSPEERLELQYYYCGSRKYTKIQSPTLLGKIFGKHESTIRRELKRGMVKHVYEDMPFERWHYNAEYAQRDAESYYSAKGPEIKLGKDWKLVEAVTELIKEQHYSPYAVIMHFKHYGWPSETRICEKTLYNYIAAGDIVGVSEKDLLYEGKRRKPKKEPKRYSRAANAAKSISNRPVEASNRNKIGHWEIDTVVSGVGKTSESILTFTEMKSRFEISRKIKDRTMASVVRELDVLERQIGAGAFRKLFKTVTADNGSEFSDITGMERSVFSGKQRLQIFFAHPYSSFERGTNENHNGIIRRFIPKGSAIGDYTKLAIRSIQDWMNSYPRKILDGLTPQMALQAELGPDFRLPGILEAKL